MANKYSEFNEIKPIICSENNVKNLLEEMREKKSEKKCEKLHNISIAILFIFSTIILYIWKRDMQPLEYASYEINYNYSFQRIFIPGFTMSQLLPIGLIKAIKSKTACIIFSLITIFVLYLSGNYLFLTLGNSKLTLIFYSICLVMYFLFGLIILFNKELYNYMKNLKWPKWFILYSSDEAKDKKLIIGTIIYFAIFLILL
ncbi:hypothetical protein [Clostridium uliginosum]|uniref:Uncharacterized protein n=1 Tax=Clostridium uliginosum TaxID=119641 RepID=A0A1I1PXI2_9CLOT|nr:hypothetical protein [Clostridium uliginosum]SFD14485.1 hypothetical protein SAMN05421842_12153 [Clostridium uliginosum]